MSSNLEIEITMSYEELANFILHDTTRNKELIRFSQSKLFWDTLLNKYFNLPDDRKASDAPALKKQFTSLCDRYINVYTDNNLNEILRNKDKSNDKHASIKIKIALSHIQVAEFIEMTGKNEELNILNKTVSFWRTLSLKYYRDAKPKHGEAKRIAVEIKRELKKEYFDKTEIEKGLEAEVENAKLEFVALYDEFKKITPTISFAWILAASSNDREFIINNASSELQRNALLNYADEFAKEDFFNDFLPKYRCQKDKEEQQRRRAKWKPEIKPLEDECSELQQPPGIILNQSNRVVPKA